MVKGLIPTYGYALPGNDLLGILVSSPEQCQEICAGDDRCKLWVYRKESKKCLLKGGQLTNNWVTNTDAISGPKQCDCKANTGVFPHKCKYKYECISWYKNKEFNIF